MSYTYREWLKKYFELIAEEKAMLNNENGFIIKIGESTFSDAKTALITSLAVM